jgi:tRNA A37 methylthiotransferase MiaB
MRETAAKLQSDFLHRQVGETHEVLFEKANRGLTGNYCTVFTKTDENLKNTIKTVKITAFDVLTKSGLEGEII